MAQRWGRLGRGVPESTRQWHDHPDAGAVGQDGPHAVGGLLERRADRVQRLGRRTGQRRGDVGERLQLTERVRRRRQHRPRPGGQLGQRGGRRQPRRLVGLAGDVPRLLPDRQRRGEELGVVAPRLHRRGDPVREGAQQVRAQRQAAAGEQLGEGELAGQQRLPLLLPVVAGHVRARPGRPAGRRRAGRRPPRTSPGRRRRPARGPSARRSRRPRPTVRVTVRARRSRCRRPAGRRRRRGRRSSRRRTACPWCGAAGRPRGPGHRRAAAARSPPAGVRRRHLSSTVSSTSTGAPSGSSATPIGAAGVPPSSPKILPEQLAGAVDHPRLAGEALGAGDVADDADDPGDGVQADQVVDGGQRVEGADLRVGRGGLDVDRSADLAGAAQAAVDERQLTGGEHQRTGADGGHVGGDRRGDGGQPDAQLGEAGVPARAGQPVMPGA